MSSRSYAVATLALLLAPTLLAPSGADAASVMDFGAAGDGVHDDTEAFQAAIGAGGPVSVPGGDFLLTHAIDAPRSGLILSGAGMKETKLLTTDAVTTLFVVPEGRLEVRDLRIEGQRAGNQSDANTKYFGSFIRWSGVSGPGAITDVAMNKCPQFCVWVDHLNSPLLIQGSTFTNIPPGVGRAGPANTDAGGGPEYQSAAVEVHGGNGGSFDFLDNVVANPPTHAGSAGGVQLYSGLRDGAAHISANFLRNQFSYMGSPNYSFGGSIYGVIDIYSQISPLNIEGNTIKMSAGAPIKVANSDYVTIKNNRISGKSSAFTAAAISIASCSRGPAYCNEANHDVVIANNTITDFFGSSGIFVSSGMLDNEVQKISRLRINGNNISDTICGIVVQQAYNPVVSNNAINGSAQAPYYFTDTDGTEEVSGGAPFAPARHLSCASRTGR